MRKLMFLTLAAFLCNFIHSRNWNAIADSICSKQKMFTDSVLSAGGWEDAQISRNEYKYVFEECRRLRKMKKLTEHFDSVSHDGDTLYFIDCYRILGGSSPRIIFFVKSNDFRDRLMYQSNFGQTSSWEYLCSFIDLMTLCNEWDLETVKKRAAVAEIFDRGETCFTRVILLPDDKFQIDVFNFDSI